jgi:hypothetical protein
MFENVIAIHPPLVTAVIPLWGFYFNKLHPKHADHPRVAFEARCLDWEKEKSPFLQPPCPHFPMQTKSYSGYRQNS